MDTNRSPNNRPRTPAATPAEAEARRNCAFGLWLVFLLIALLLLAAASAADEADEAASFSIVFADNVQTWRHS